MFEYTLPGTVKESDLSASGLVEHVRITEWLHESRVAYLKAQKSGLYEEALESGLVPAVTHLKIDMPAYLRRDDGYDINVHLTRNGARYVFESQIKRQSDGEICATSTAEIVFTKDGRPIRENVLKV